MRRHTWSLLLAAGSIGWLGCSSADEGGQESSMEEMAAVIGQQQATAESTDSGTGNAVVVRTAEEADEEGPPTVPLTSLPTRRGFDLFDLSNEAAYVLVKADADKVAEVLAAQSKGTLTKDAMGKSPEDEDGGTIVFQLNGHPWSVFALWPDEDFEKFAGEFSKEIGADVLTFANSDFSGWSFVHLFRGGEEVEALHWGEDLSDIGAAPNASDWDTVTKISTDHGDDIVITDQWLFRSKLRKATEQELQQGEAFNNELFKHYDAYLPDVEQMPWEGESGNIESPLGTAAFKGVHLVVMPME